MKIDSHQHYWKSQGQEKKGKQTGSRDQTYLPEQLRPLMETAGIDKTVVVQASPTEKETTFLLELAEREETIAGVVGWLDLEADDFREKWKSFSTNEKFSGLRPMIQDLPSDWIVSKKIISELEFLTEQEFPIDLQANPRHLRYIIQLLEQVPDLHAVVDHLAKPLIEEGQLEPWAQEMKEIATYPNTMCKLSGMVPEKENGSWSTESIQPYAHEVLEAFGTDRVMFGSDWPVCLKSATYKQIIELFEAIVPLGTTKEEWRALYGGNAARFYHLHL